MYDVQELPLANFPCNNSQFSQMDHLACIISMNSYVHISFCSFLSDLACIFVRRLLDHVISQPPLPPHRTHGLGLLSSVTGNLSPTHGDILFL